MSQTADPPALDLVRLNDFLKESHPGLVRGRLGATLLNGGKSNLTYRVTDGATTWVLRRPPLGRVLESAHDMKREVSVIRALANSPVPVPEVVAFCEDKAVLGAPFYLMNWVEGEVYRNLDDTSTLGATRARALSFALVDALAELHSVHPEEVGLSNFGRPVGFMDRQVARFRRQLDVSRSRDLPGLVTLGERLAAAVPVSVRAGIVHGDYRLDNVMMSADDQVAAIVDWELAALGDPLADLGLLLCYWDGVPGPLGHVVSKGIDASLGFPSPDQVIARYAQATGADLGPLNWYIAFGYFKMAVIREGIHVRHLEGSTVGEGFGTVGELVEPLMEQGLRTLEER